MQFGMFGLGVNRSGGPYSTHILQRGKAQSKAAGGKGAFAKEDTFRKKAGDRQKDKNQKSTPLGVEPQHSKDNSNSDNHPFLFLAERSKTPQDPKLKEGAQCQF